MNPSAVNDESQIRQLLEAWATATQEGRLDDVLAHHAPDVRIYDVLPPLYYDSAQAYRRSWGDWQPDTQGEAQFALQELAVVAGPEVAFAHGFIQCGGTLPNGETFADRVRATFCLQKKDGAWQVTHQHISKPFSSKGE
ncbi:MAG: YybH family protein [Candidatus Sericytochromatia bacterium]